MTTPNDQPLSRRAARQAQQDSEVAFRTEVRQRVPHYDAPADEQHDSTLPPTPPLAPPAAAPSAYQPEHVRRRDFRPPAEQSAPIAQPADAPLDYRTQGTEAMDALRATLVETSTPAPAEPHVISEHTLSRRELRAQREQTPVDHQPPALVEPTVDAAVEQSPAPSVAPASWPPAPVQQAHAPVQQPSAPVQLPAAPVQQSPAPVQQSPATPQQPWPSGPTDVIVPSQPPLAPPPVAPTAASPSTGTHWSVGIHDDEDPFENTFSREVGSSTSATNTNALVLPAMPAGSIAGPVTGTGEIIITGMIDLPRVVSATGTMPTIHESPDIDDVLDPSEVGLVSTDSAPVSALKAVSSHAPTHSVMTGKRSSSNTVTTVLVASTVIMAVVAIGLFVVAAANGLF